MSRSETCLSRPVFCLFAQSVEELFYGNIDPNSKQIICGSHYDEATRTVAETEQQLLAMLEGDARSLFEAHVSAHGNLVLLTAQEHCISGFRIRARMAAEAFGNADGFLGDIEP